MSKFSDLRAVFREAFKQGVCPVDSRQPIPDELATSMVAELVEYGVPKDALIGVVDAFLILSTHLKENGYTNLVLLENVHSNLTENQDKYYNKIQSICKKSGITYYVPPMNNYNRCEMEFDVIIGNPPYQNDKDSGNKRGSSTNPLWWDITGKCLNLLKKNGILSYITPTNMVNGGDSFTKLTLGVDRKYDLKKVDFSADDAFDVGIPICRWVLKNELTEGNVADINDGRQVDTSTTLKISKDAMLDSILNTMFDYDRKLSFSTSGYYDYRSGERSLIKQNLPKEWARDLSDSPTDVHKYGYNINGKIKYLRVSGKMAGTWRVFYPQLQQPTNITVARDMEAASSTFTMCFDTEADALKTQEYLSDPMYRWVVDQTRVSGRVTAVISKLPNAPIEEVLTTEQINYIKEQIK